MDKKALRKLMLLNNSATNKKLEKIASDFSGVIKRSKNNDEIFEKISIVKEFVYSVPNVALDICKFIIKNPKPNRPKLLGKGKLEVYGKNHKDLILKCIELMEDIRYHKTKEVLDVLAILSQIDDKEISTKALETIENTAKYNYHALKNIDLQAQKISLEFVEKKNSKNANFQNISPILIELLSPIFEGSEMKDPNTFSWMTGSLPVTNELKKIRARSISLVFQLFDSQNNSSSRIKALQILDTALRFPHSSDYGDDFEDMVAENAKQIMDGFSSRVFGRRGKVVLELPIIAEIESQLNWIIRRPIRKAKIDAQKLIAKLDKNEAYRAYRLLAVSMRDYVKGKKYEDVKKERERDVNKFFNKIDQTNIEHYKVIFEKIGKNLDRQDYWEWSVFSSLLLRVASERPELAKVLLKSDILSNKFAEEFMAGFRKSKNWALWDQYYAEVLRKKDIHLIIQLFSSFFPANGDVDRVRKEDLNILAKAIEGKEEFKVFNIPGLDNRQLHNAIMLSLSTMYNFNPKAVEPLICKEIKLNPKINNLLISNIELGIIREQINLDGWEEANIDLILGYMTTVKNLDHDLQSLMKAIAQKYPDKIIETFIERIELEIKNRKKRKPFEANSYEAIPYHFDDDLAKILTESPNYHDKVQSLVTKMANPGNVAYNWNISELIKKIGGKEHMETITNLIDSKDDNNLKIALELLRSFEKPNIDLLFRIVTNCSGPKSSVWKPAGAQFFNSGVVSGEYGLRDYYRGVLREVEKVKKAEKDNENIQLFTKDLIPSLRDYIERETERVEEEKIIRKIEFDS